LSLLNLANIPVSSSKPELSLLYFQLSTRSVFGTLQVPFIHVILCGQSQDLVISMPQTVADRALRSRNDLHFSENGTVSVAALTVDCTVVPRDEASALEVAGIVAAVDALTHPDAVLPAMEAFST
jgi:hypothetical protein